MIRYIDCDEPCLDVEIMLLIYLCRRNPRWWRPFVRVV